MKKLEFAYRHLQTLEKQIEKEVEEQFPNYTTKDTDISVRCIYMWGYNKAMLELYELINSNQK